VRRLAAAFVDGSHIAEARQPKRWPKSNASKNRTESGGKPPHYKRSR